jgi:prophage regulatory protein
MIEKILRRPEVQRITGLSRATIYEAMARGDFPKAIRIGKRAVGWPQSAIAQWLATRPEAEPLPMLPKRTVSEFSLYTGDPRFDEITKHKFPDWDMDAAIEEAEKRWQFN